jgi:hypothetical protein
MSKIDIDVLHAFKGLGASDDAAEKAAAAVYVAMADDRLMVESRFDKLEAKIDRFEAYLADIKADLAGLKTGAAVNAVEIAGVKHSVSLVMWIVGVTLAIALATFGKSMLHGG